MATENDGLVSDLLYKSCDVPGDFLRSVLLVRLRSGCPAEAQHVWDNDLQAQREEMGDLIAPSHTQVRPVVNNFRQ